MKKPVVWTRREKVKFLKRAWELFIGAHGSWAQCMFAANREMPSERQVGQGSLYTKSKRYRAEAEALAHKSEPSLPVVESADVQSELAPRMDATTELATALIGMMRSIVREEVNEAAGRLAQQITQLSRGQVADARALIPMPKPVPRSGKMRVLVVGMLNQQQTQIENDFKGKFDFTFHQANESNHLVAGRVAHVDRVLVNTGKINHSLYDVLKAKASGKLCQFDGGVSSVRRILEMLTNEAAM